jgi:UDP-N-acetylglucosamine--N-acetylmuramyl-(pentapeptide) pyrophosphoryl-undecaprenol N-acetylglucosamine transferase
MVERGPHPHADQPDAGGSVLFAGGGTGGHISPGLAVAEALHELRPDIGRIFACSERAIDRTMLENAGERFTPLAAQPFGIRPAQLLRFMRGWRKARAQTLELLDRHRVSVVIALGGFVAAPAAAAPKSRGVPIVLLNLDAVPGKANRMIARHATEVLSTFPIAGHVRFTCVTIPMPVRRSALASTFGDARACRSRLGLDPERPVLFITGASQGSQGINSFVREVASKHRDWLDGWQILHLTGPGREGDWVEAYQRLGVPAVVRPFLHEMGAAWGAAELAISRAGANSVAEVSINAVPTIFLPYPHHADRHQFENARPIVEAGGAAVCEEFAEPGRNLAAHGETVRRLLRDPAARAEMRSSLEHVRPMNGAEVVARRLIDHILRRW